MGAYTCHSDACFPGYCVSLTYIPSDVCFPAHILLMYLCSPSHCDMCFPGYFVFLSSLCRSLCRLTLYSSNKVRLVACSVNYSHFNGTVDIY